MALFAKSQERKAEVYYMAECLRIIAINLTHGAYDPPSLYNIMEHDGKTDEEHRQENEKKAQAIISRIKGKFKDESI